MVLRYVEANAQRAGLVSRAEQWRWGSLWQRVHGVPRARPGQRPALSAPPVPLPPVANWTATVHQAQDQEDLERLHQSICRGAPLGRETWVQGVVEALGLQATQRPRGRPRRGKNGDSDAE